MLTNLFSVEPFQIKQISWTHALRQIVINCYKFHGREDLLPAFSEEDDKSNILIQQPSAHSSTQQSSGSQGSQSQQTVGVVRISSTGSSKGNSSPTQIIAASPTALATATQVTVDGSERGTWASRSIELVVSLLISFLMILYF